jgi:hypothetical protein
LVKAFRDAAQVAGDVAVIATCFANVPAGLAKVAKDAYTAVVDRSVEEAKIVLSDVRELRIDLGTDATAAGSAFGQLEADVQKVIDDLTAPTV